MKIYYSIEYVNILNRKPFSYENYGKTIMLFFILDSRQGNVRNNTQCINARRIYCHGILNQEGI